MIESWMLIALFLPSPVVFIGGFLLGKHHIRRLARNGGEKRYPSFVQETVQKYRHDREWVNYD